MGYLRLACFTFFCFYNHHAVFCTGAIHGRGRGVFQYVYTFYIVGIESGYRGANKCIGIAGGELLGRYVHHVFQHHTVYNPERLVIACNRRSAAYAYLGCRAERARYVLYRYAGCAALQHAANIHCAVGLYVAAGKLHYRAGKQALVHFLVAGRNHGYLVQRGYIFLQLYAKVGLAAYRNFGGRIAYE